MVFESRCILTEMSCFLDCRTKLLLFLGYFWDNWNWKNIFSHLRWVLSVDERQSWGRHSRAIFYAVKEGLRKLAISVSAHTINKTLPRWTLALKFRNMLLKAIVGEAGLKKKVSSFVAERKRKTFIKKTLLKSSTFPCLRSKTTVCWNTIILQMSSS